MMKKIRNTLYFLQQYTKPEPHQREKIFFTRVKIAGFLQKNKKYAVKGVETQTPFVH